MKVPTKSDLYAQIEALTKENTRLLYENEKEQRQQWEKHIPKAAEMFHKMIHRKFPNMVCDVSFKHVDKGGYWFTFKLLNDKREQTYCIRHNEI